ncbi:hypothetical protein HPB47_017311, partial [Ixodes persulcatus]
MVWPARKNLNADLVSYYEVRSELSVVDGLLLRSERVVNPTRLTAAFVQNAYEYHPGIVKTKRRLREKF